MRYLFFLISLLTINDCYAQKDTIVIWQQQHLEDTSYYQLDTLIQPVSTDRAFLMGSMMLPSSRNQLEARKFDVRLIDMEVSKCERNTELAPSLMLSFPHQNDSLIEISVRGVENCCYAFLGDIGVYDDSTLNIIAYPYGNYHCACNCEYTLKYTIIRNALLNENKSAQLTSVILNGDPTTRSSIVSRNSNEISCLLLKYQAKHTLKYEDFATTISLFKRYKNCNVNMSSYYFKLGYLYHLNKQEELRDQSFEKHLQLFAQQSGISVNELALEKASLYMLSNQYKQLKQVLNTIDRGALNANDQEAFAFYKTVSDTGEFATKKPMFSFRLFND